MWCSDHRHNTDTEPDGELMSFATQIQMQILIRWDTGNSYRIHFRCHCNGLRWLRTSSLMERKGSKHGLRTPTRICYVASRFPNL